MPVWILTEKLRERLAKPNGELISGSVEETAEKVKAIIEKEKPRMVITVGDLVSKSLLDAGVRPHVMVVDGKVMRRRVKPLDAEGRSVIRAENPSGVITEEAWNAVRKAISVGDALVMVDGEEDLLALPATLEAPLGAMILYGQPREGVVIIRATEDVKREAKAIAEEMKKN